VVRPALYKIVQALVIRIESLATTDRSWADALVLKSKKGPPTSQSIKSTTQFIVGAGAVV
jgi:hypothetical protein